MRWPWQPRPGMVRISNRKWIELLQASLKAADLDVAAVEKRAERSESRVIALEQQRARLDEALMILFLARGRMSPLAMRGLLVDLPTTDDGHLDEAEFAGQVFDATVEAAREAETMKRSQR